MSAAKKKTTTRTLDAASLPHPPLRMVQQAAEALEAIDELARMAFQNEQAPGLEIVADAVEARGAVLNVLEAGLPR